MKSRMSSRRAIRVIGARENNLKNVSVEIPRGRLTVVTGPSGSGKSTLAFDVVYREGQRRYLEGMSAYARSFLDVAAKPDVDKVENLSPTIAIDQKSIARSPRSTVGTLTEISDYLRILFAKVGDVHCPKCGDKLERKSARDILAQMLSVEANGKYEVYAPLDMSPGRLFSQLARIQKEGYTHARLNGKAVSFDELFARIRECEKGARVEVLIDRFSIQKNRPDKERILDSLEEAFKEGGGMLVLVEGGDSGKERVYQSDYFCQRCFARVGDISPRHFSFNHPEGACSACSGLGERLVFDPDAIITSEDISLEEGALGLLNRFLGKSAAENSLWKLLVAAAQKNRFSLSAPLATISEEQKRVIFYGDEDGDFVGVIPFLEKKYVTSDSEHLRNEMAKYMHSEVCSVCGGARLRKESLSVVIGGENIAQWLAKSIDRFPKFLDTFWAREAENYTGVQKNIAAMLIKEIRLRIGVLETIGLGYLALNRMATTLSGGEAQRIRLAVQIVSELSGVVYVLDEPSMGLHSRDTNRLIRTMRDLVNADNTVIVVEHDRAVMEAADWIVDIGPGAGESGGRILFSGTHRRLMRSRSVTAQYLSGRKQIHRVPIRDATKKFLVVRGAREHNLKNITVRIPLERMVVVSGVSGSGKSSLVHGIVAKALRKHFFRAKSEPGKHASISGLAYIDKVISINQDPIGRTPRSNVATYTGIFSLIREVFASLPQSEQRRYGASQFSFNLKGGRCEECQGDGVKKIEMYLLPDMFVECEACGGTRYGAKTLEIEYQGVTIAGVLDMSVEYAKRFFHRHRHICERLGVLERVGLGYLHLGQSAPDLSGGEAQRIKLATELARKSTGRTLYILDEPTIGLHFEDVSRLLSVLSELVEKGNTVLVVEHNTDIIRAADWVIDMGPEGGVGGGSVVFSGMPKDLKRCKKGWTGRYL